MPPGFNPNGVIAAKASLDNVRYHDPAAFRKLLDESLAAMREIPGVQSAALGLTLPYERALINGVILRDGKDAGQEISTNEVYVTPSYFDTLRIPVVEGRTFTQADGPDAQPVVVINQSFTRKFLHAVDPVGRFLKIENKDVLVVGRGSRHHVVLRRRIKRGFSSLNRAQRWPVQSLRASHVDVGFVYRDHLQLGRETVQDFVNFSGVVPVTVGVSVDEDCLWAELGSRAQRHRGVNTEFSGGIRRSGNDSTLITLAAHNDWLALQRRVEEFFD